MVTGVDVAPGLEALSLLPWQLLCLCTARRRILWMQGTSQRWGPHTAKTCLWDPPQSICLSDLPQRGLRLHFDLRHPECIRRLCPLLSKYSPRNKARPERNLYVHGFHDLIYDSCLFSSCKEDVSIKQIVKEDQISMQVEQIWLQSLAIPTRSRDV